MPDASPNVLFIVVDDLNHWIGAYGTNHNVKTPNIDRLAASGTLFRKAYCSAPYCNASRMSFFTGLRPTTTGIYENEPLPTAPALAPTLPELFRQSGYKTISAGKTFHGSFDYVDEAKSGSGKARWLNLSNRPEYWDESLDHTFEPLPKGRPYNTLFGDLPRRDFPQPYHHFDWGPFDDDAPDDAVARRTIDVLSRGHDAPFFCAMGLYRPHLPWFAPKRFFDMYPLEDVVLPVVKIDDLDDVPPIGVEFAKAQFDHDRIERAGLWRSAVRGYLACISYCDALVGSVLDALDASPHRDNTIVVFLSDNGYHLGEKLHWSKFALWEEASRVPLIVRMPQRQSPVAPHHAPVSLLDVFPTLVDACGLTPPPRMEGQSLLDIVMGEAVAPRLSPVITTWRKGNHSVRKEHWRYTRYHDGGEELYDHKTDPYEWTNLAGLSQHRGVCDALAAEIDAHCGDRSA